MLLMNKYSSERVRDTNHICTKRSYHNMNYTIPKYVEMIRKNSKLFHPSFFEDRESKAIGAVVRTIKPIVKYDNDQVELKYNVGTRGNGKDAPRWPDDLMTEVVV